MNATIDAELLHEAREALGSYLDHLDAIHDHDPEADGGETECERCSEMAGLEETIRAVDAALVKAVTPVSDDIGSYYDRKRVAANAAWHVYLEHRSHCTDCRGLHCREATKLKTRAIDAGNTGD